MSISPSQSGKVGREPSKTPSSPTASATGSSTRLRLESHTRETSRGSEELARRPPRAHASSRTIREHIYPQPPTDPYWKQRFSEADAATYLNDLGNLCLTKDNSSYRNYSFDKKKGEPGQSTRCYANAGLRQESELGNTLSGLRKQSAAGMKSWRHGPSSAGNRLLSRGSRKSSRRANTDSRFGKYQRLRVSRTFASSRSCAPIEALSLPEGC
jgi:hypothetical protein